MRYIAIAEDELMYELMTGPALEGDEVLFVTGDQNLRKRIARKGGDAISGDLHSPRTYERADLEPDSLVLINLEEETSLRRAVAAVREVSPEVPVLAVETSPEHLDAGSLREEIPDLEVLHLHASFQGALRKELERARTRKLVAAYKADFSAAERVLILVHDEPDPDSIGSALALRTLLGRDRRTAIFATHGTFSRPENVKMAQLLDLEVQQVESSDLESYQRIAMVDAQPNLFGGLADEVDLVIDHHPVRKGYKARFQDIRPNYGATATILMEHLEAAGSSISERLATAMLYAIKSDTLFLERNTSRADVEAFGVLYRIADPASVRKIEGAGVSVDHLQYLRKALRNRELKRGLFYAHIGRVDREDYVPYLAEFFLELQEVEWAAVSGVLEGNLVISMRNLGYQRSAGKLMKELFDEYGSAGGRRAASKAVIPLKEVRQRAGSAREGDISTWVWKLLQDSVAS